ncbi:MAG: AAA family ATPase [Myxococcales bacterium]|nr:AAA family ATPase [Myxococcales bacterium]
MSTQAAPASPPKPVLVPGYVRSLVFQGLRSLLDVRVELASRLTVLVGANGSGKSSVLDGVHHLSRLLTTLDGQHLNLRARALEHFVGESRLDQLVTRGVLHPDLLLAALTVDGGLWLTASARDEDDHFALSVAAREATQGPPPWSAMGVVEVGSPMSLRDLQSTPQAVGLARCTRLRLNARRVRKPSYSEDEEPTVAEDGSHLATALAWLGNNHREARDAIEADLARVVPGVRSIKVPRTKIYRTEEEALRIDDELVTRHRKRELVADTVEVEFAEAGFLPIAQLSEGTVLALALLTVLHSPSCPNLVLLDDIEQALHPDAQYELLEIIRKVLDEKPNLQVIATTHSPYLLDSLDPAEVQVLALDEHGHTHVKRFDEHPRAAKLMQSLHLSEMWSGLGEDWVLDR